MVVSGSVCCWAILTCVLSSFYNMLTAYAEINWPASSTTTNVWFNRIDTLPLELRTNLKSVWVKIPKYIVKESAFSRAFKMEPIDGKAAVPKGGGRLPKDLKRVIGKVPPDAMSSGRDKTAPNRSKYFTDDRKKSDRFFDANDRALALSNRTMTKRSTAYGEYSDRSQIGSPGDAFSAEKLVEPLQGVYSPRTEYRRTGEDARTSPRQSEPLLVTSTFPLSGDSAHNQAMGHWVGENSSVSSN